MEHKVPVGPAVLEVSCARRSNEDTPEWQTFPAPAPCEALCELGVALTLRSLQSGWDNDSTMQ